MISGGDMNWNGNGAQEMAEEEAWLHLRQGTLFFLNKVQDALNVPNTGETRVRTRTTSRGPKGSTYTVYPNPSRPGEPPRKVTGTLAGNVDAEFDRETLRARVGITKTAWYGGFLELFRDRPWLMGTINKFREQIAAYFAK